MNSWIRKFQLAVRGIYQGMQGQSSFVVHLPIAVVVLLAAAGLDCHLWQWCVLCLCIGLVMTAELANSAIEELARGLCHEQNTHVGRALDIASGAVLVASLTAGLIGTVVFLSRLLGY